MVQITLYGAGRQPCSGGTTRPANRQPHAIAPRAFPLFVAALRGPWPRSRLPAHPWRARAFSHRAKRCRAPRCIRGWRARWAGSARSKSGSPRTRKDIRRAQKLRYEVFYEEMSAIPDVVSRLKRRDIDAFDGDLRPPARHRPRRPGRAFRQTAHGPRQAEGRRHLPPAAAGNRRAPRRLLLPERVRHRAAAAQPPRQAVPGARAVLRAEALSRQAHGRAAVARHLDLCPPPPHRRDVRLRQHRGHGPRAARPAAQLPAPPCARQARMARPGAAPARGGDESSCPPRRSTGSWRCMRCRR